MDDDEDAEEKGKAMPFGRVGGPLSKLVPPPTCSAQPATRKAMNHGVDEEDDGEDDDLVIMEIDLRQTAKACSLT